MSIEVADSSLKYDRFHLVTAYAKSGITDYSILMVTISPLAFDGCAIAPRELLRSAS